MTVSIPPEFEQFVAQQLALGEYQSAEEVISAGLQVLQEVKRRQAEFREEVQAGVTELDRGEGIKVSQEGLRAFFDDIQSRGQQRYEASRRPT